MSTTLADAEPVDRSPTSEPVMRTFVASDGEAIEDNVQSVAARGIGLAVLIAAPVWALIAVTIYLLL
ncbi:MAG: hypothetical protein ABSC06_00045 [Rhodopila sp.]|jgi:hypothetical protein